MIEPQEIERFLAQLIRGQRLVRQRQQSNPDSSFWRNIGVIIGDVHFIRMVTARLHAEGGTWRDALQRMEETNCALLALFVDGQTRDFSIDLHGACKFLREIAGDVE